MDSPAHPVAHKFTNDAKAAAFDVILDGPGDIVHPFARDGLGDALVEGLFGDIQEPLAQDTATADCDRRGGVADESAVSDADIQGHNVTEAQNAWSPKPMHHFLIN